jgi:hypothetical protein
MALLSAVQKSTGLLKVPIGFDRLATRGGLKPGHAVHVPNASTAARDGRGLEAGSRQRREIGSDGVKGRRQGFKAVALTPADEVGSIGLVGSPSCG